MYQYQADDPEQACAACREGFEALQSYSDPPRTECPVCKSPCHRVISAANLPSQPSDPLSSENLAKQGFGQYRKEKDGEYRKTAGAGPDKLKK